MDIKGLIKKFEAKYRISSKKENIIKDFDPQDKDFLKEKEEAVEVLEDLLRRIDQLQDVLYAQHQHKVLVIFQGMDTSGKDGAIRTVFRDVDPQGVRVVGFKAPTSTELDHDYLWRIHHSVPGKGEIVVFNRSHYEDVLVVRVRNLVPQNVWQRRYQHINDFEKMLSDEGTTILKFFLHIDKGEQRKRLEERLQDPNKRWKFNPDDLKERERWDDYMDAYNEVLKKTSTEYAPWYIVPANDKWFRNVVVASIVIHQLEKLSMTYPKQKFDINSIRIS